jgi:imidazolonepropionase-like amidohydrolase
MANARVVASLFAALTVAASAQPPDAGSRALVIAHVTVIDTVGGTTMPDVAVLIRDGRIVSVDKNGAAPPGAEIVSGRGKFLMPGLWDMHVHLSYARASALPVLVANGVTGVRDMGSDLAEIDRWRAEIAANTRVGPSIVRAGPILNDREFNTYQLAIANAADARMAVRTLKKVGVDVIKTHRQTSRDAYFAAADEAKTLGLPFSGHIPVTVSPTDAADAAPASVEHVLTLFEGTFATEHAGQDLAAEIARWRKTPEAGALFAKYARNGTALDATLVTFTYLVEVIESGKPDPNTRYIAASARRLGDQQLADARRDPGTFVQERKPLDAEFQAVTGLMHRAGVSVVTGTDTSVLHPPGFVVHDELALLVKSGLTAAEALRAGTVNAAALFPSQNAGSIAPGKRADLVLVDANPLDDVHNTRRISGVVLRGKYLNRETLDRLLRDAARLAESS